MKFEVNITKTRFFALLIIGLAIVSSVAVYAYNSTYNDPAVMGHSFDELFPTELYEINSNCAGAGALTLKDFCQTKICSSMLENTGFGAQVQLQYFDCSGGCWRGSPSTCPNVLL